MSQRTPSHCPAILVELADHRLLQVRVAVVELQRVGPAVEVRVAAVGEHQRASSRLHAAVVLRCASQVALAAMDKVVRMLVDPRVIRRHVVRNEVEHQLQSALLQPLSQACQRRSATQIAMDGVALDGEPGAGDVFVLQVRQRFGELATPLGIRARDRLRRRAGLPHAQEPDPVEAQLGQAVQLGVRNVIQRRALAQSAGQLGQPDAGVDLVQRRVAWIGHVRLLNSFSPVLRPLVP